jgi:hypothetical protein
LIFEHERKGERKTWTVGLRKRAKKKTKTRKAKKNKTKKPRKIKYVTNR